MTTTGGVENVGPKHRNSPTVKGAVKCIVTIPWPSEAWRIAQLPVLAPGSPYRVEMLFSVGCPFTET